MSEDLACEHGVQKRKCLVCELTEELALEKKSREDLAQEIKKLENEKDAYRSAGIEIMRGFSPNHADIEGTVDGEASKYIAEEGRD